MRQRIARRLAALGALLLAIVGIVAIAPEAPALNAEGIHTIHTSCVATGHNSTTDWTYSMVLTQVDPATNQFGARYWYTFQLLSSTYHGTPPPGNPVRSPSLSIGPSGQTPAGESWISAGFGGAQTTANHTWPNGTAQDGVTLTDGINVDWTPRVISTRPNLEGNNRLRFSIYGIPGGCVQYIDLGFPDAPAGTGTQYLSAGCDDYSWVKANYTLTHNSGDSYSLQVDNAEYHSDVSTGDSEVNEIQLNVSGLPGGDQIADSGSANWLNPPPHADFFEVDGLAGVDFPTITFDYEPGLNIDFNIVLRRGDEVCDTHFNISRNWDPTFIGSFPAFEDISFDDCTTSATVLKIKPSWEKTTDGQYYRLKSLQIFQSNSFGSTIVLDAGNATVLGGVTVAEMKFPPTQLVTIGSGVSLANRTITSGEWQTFPVSDASKWVRVSAPASHSSAPSSFYTAAADYPTVTIRGKVFSSIGVQCVPSNPGGTGDISELDFQPVDLFP